MQSNKYHLSLSAEYDISDLLSLWGMKSRLLPFPHINPALLETVRELRPEDDPEEWPTRLESTIFLIEITSIYDTNVYTDD